jgi:hypothetical protein
MISLPQARAEKKSSRCMLLQNVSNEVVDEGLQTRFNRLAVLGDIASSSMGAFYGGLMLRFKAKCLFALIVAMMILCCAFAAQATVFDCTTEKVFLWTEGRLQLAKNINFQPHSIIRFDDETGVLLDAVNRKYAEAGSFNSFPMKVMEKLDSGVGLTAVKIATSNGIYDTTNVFRLRPDKVKKYVFFYYVSLEDSVREGSCDIYGNENTDTLGDK